MLLKPIMAHESGPHGSRVGPENTFGQEILIQSFRACSHLTCQRALGMLASLSLYLVSNKSSTERDCLDGSTINLEAALNSEDHQQVMSGLLSTIANLPPSRDSEGNLRSYYDLQDWGTSRRSLASTNTRLLSAPIAYHNTI